MAALTAPVIQEHNAKDVLVSIVNGDRVAKLGRTTDNGAHLQLEVHGL